MVQINLLSVDGGGIRGLIPLHILQQLSLFEPFKSRSFRALAGTSTGAIVVAGLSLKGGTNTVNGIFQYSISELIDLYEKNAWQIFKRKGLGLLQSKYSDEGIEQILLHYFQENQLKDCGIPLVIPTFDMASYEPVFFKSRYFEDPGTAYKEMISRWKLWEILRSTSAAPTYFPRFEKDNMLLVDGGLFVNNPALALFMDVVRHPDYYNIPLAPNLQINLVSLGTGRSKGSNKAPEFGGQWHFREKAIDISMFGNAQSSHYNLEQLISNNGGNAGILNFEFNYLRLSPEIDEDKFAEIDCVSADGFTYYKDLTKRYLIENFDVKKKIDFFLRKVYGKDEPIFV